MPAAPRKLELLAPARDTAIAREAILHGADAVYIGGPSHGARAAAGNSIDDIAELTRFAHIYGVKVYVTLNTIIYENELAEVTKTVRKLYDAGVDALIVQDMALLRMDIPPIDLHASTQCDIRTPEKATFLARCGYSQLVLPREFSLDEIRQVRDAVGDDVALEAFVHGALCVSYSGDCQASCVAKGRSANRGECAQMCRLPYDLVDGKGNVLMRDKHLLSLRDLNRLDTITLLADAGVSSFKIEGRLKDAAYVKNTVSAYRQAIDRLIKCQPDRYCHASHGESRVSFTADVDKSFNRGFTSYFIDGHPDRQVSMANLSTPKWVGQRIGAVIRCQGNTITARLNTELSNGDGLGYYTTTGEYTGFRINRVEGNKLYVTTPIDIPSGTPLYRNRDVKTDAQLAQKTAERTIAVNLTLSLNGERLTLDIKAANGISSSATATITPQSARTPQLQARERALSKLGGTPYRLASLQDDVADDTFVAASVLNDLRQRAVAQLTDNILAAHTRRERRAEDPEVRVPGNGRMTYHDNVANSLATRFYQDHGATEIQPAIEISKPQGPLTVMTTRYCIRRELGACKLTAEADKLPSELYLTNPTATYRLKFDCKNCLMQLIAAEKGEKS